MFAYLWQIRIYMFILAARLTGMGVAYHIASERLSNSPVFDVLIQIVSLEQLGYFLIVAGILTIGGVLFPREAPVRAILCASVGIYLLLGLSIVASGEFSPVTINFLAFAAIDALVATSRLKQTGIGS